MTEDTEVVVGEVVEEGGRNGDNEEHEQVTDTKEGPAGEFVPWGPKDAWREASQSAQESAKDKKDQLLDATQDKASELAMLIYSPDGKELVAGTNNMVAVIVDRDFEGRKPKLNTAGIAEDLRLTAIERNDHKSRIQEWENAKNARVGELMDGGMLNSKEENVYLQIEDKDYKGRGRSGEHIQMLNGFQSRLNRIGAARSYQRELKKSASDRGLPKWYEPRDSKLRFHDATIDEVKEAFVQGWGLVKSRYEKTDSNNQDSTEKVK